MNLIINIILLLSLTFITGDTPQSIQWDANYRINWEDFKGKPDSNSPFVASTQSGMSFSYSMRMTNNSPEITTEVQSNFYPEESWYQPERVNEIILKHEQGHFDISEIHARKLRKTIAEFRFTKKAKTEISNLYQRAEKERQTMQKKFDRETNHSMNIEKEIEWQRFIVSELKRLDKWKQ